MRETRCGATCVTAQVCIGALKCRKCVRLVNVAVVTICLGLPLSLSCRFFVSGVRHVGVFSELRAAVERRCEREGSSDQMVTERPTSDEWLSLAARCRRA